jgi:CrcB protein
MVLTYFWVALGGALGSMARFWMGGWIAGLIKPDYAGPAFPWGTLAINVLGSVVIGLVAGLTLTTARVAWHPDVRIFLMVGVCGGFTTFSAFSLQTLELIQAGDGGMAIGYVISSVLLCVSATWAGVMLGRL